MKGFDYLSRSYSEPLNFQEMSDFQLSKDDNIPVRAGQKLPNGAILLMEKVVRIFPHRRDSVVLCVNNGYQPFVTWYRWIHSDIPETNDDGSHNSWYNIKDYCETGHYFTELNNAIADFEARVAKHAEMFDKTGALKV